MDLPASTHAGCWENTISARDLQAFLEFSTSQVGYDAGKPIESVVYCFYKLTLGFLWVYRHNKPQVFNQSERAYYLSFFYKNEWA